MDSISTNYQDLMLYRIHEILLIASDYDSYILEEDGRLTEQILNEYIGMNLSYAPRLWKVSTAIDSMKMLSERSLDLIIIMIRISDMNPIRLSQKIKKLYPEKPIILLVFDESEIKLLPLNYKKSIDNVFIWAGNSNVFPAIIKYIEDKENVDRDTIKGGVRSIIVVEDTPRYYSSILPMLYKIIVYHTKHLIDKSLNDTQKLLHLRARPKILLAQNYEQAFTYFNKYKNNLLGIISDIRFPKNNVMNNKAGIQLTDYMQSKEEGIPIILQTTEMILDDEISKITDLILNKNSHTLFNDLSEMIIKHFGFGDFIFKQTDKNKEQLKASNLDDLLNGITNISSESLAYHSSRNHFSNWLSARGEFELANQFRKLDSSHFDNIKERRSYHINLLENTLSNSTNQSKLAQFKDTILDDSNFIRIGSGSLGGKARGMAFLNKNIYNKSLKQKFPSIKIKIPKTIVLSTEEFDIFMKKNNLWSIALNSKDNNILIQCFLKAKLSREVIKSLKTFLSKNIKPLAVRSSGLLEDSQYQSLAGMYSTFMLPNSSKDNKERLSQVCEAIKRIYASTFFTGPTTLLAQSIQRHEEEKMAIIIMEMVGKKHAERFYPTFSGVAQSYNYYPVSHMDRKEGIAFLALGLGKTIADGQKSLRYSPYYPEILSQYYSEDSMIKNSQNTFYSLDINNGINPMTYGENNNLASNDLNQAEKDGELKYLASVLDPNDNILRDSLSEHGSRVITFKSIIKYNYFPLNELLKYFLEFGEASLGCPVEIEFAVNLNTQDKHEFSLLQIKPMTIDSFKKTTINKDILPENILCSSDVVLGNGVINDITHIIYVDVENFNVSKTEIIAYEIEKLNKKLDNKSYILIGPGRWGSTDPWLGIPVEWEQINNAKVIIELGIEGLEPDPSFGSHFFQNLTSLHLGYYTFNKSQSKKNINWNLLSKLKVIESLDYVKLIQIDKKLESIINGKTGQGVIFQK